MHIRLHFANVIAAESCRRLSELLWFAVYHITYNGYRVNKAVPRNCWPKSKPALRQAQIKLIMTK